MIFPSFSKNWPIEGLVALTLSCTFEPRLIPLLGSALAGNNWFTGFFVSVVVANRLPVQRLEELFLRVLQDVRRLQVQLKILRQLLSKLRKNAPKIRQKNAT